MKGIILQDYTELRELGFRGGLETHQQLATEGKLFCRCSTKIRNDEHHQEILRHMRPTLSEFGEYDGTALMEFKTKKQVHYLLYNDSVCTYEMDDTPPFQANPEAIDSALQLAMMFNMSLVDELHITRKQYLDGSIPTGFQRTAIVGVNGVIPFLGRELHFIQMSMEEDACREVSDIGHHVIFRTDRLSIPLVEPVTAPELYTPLEMAIAAKLIGETMRSTHLVRRGIGSVRQDVNVSIRGGTRIEIKGVAKIGYIEALSRIEAYRQKALLDLRHELQTSDLTTSHFKPEFTMLEDIQAKGEGFDPEHLNSTGHKAALMILPGFKKLIHWPTQPGLSFIDELRGRVRVIACLEYNPVLQCATDTLRSHINLSTEDAALVFAGPEEDLETAVKEICIRIEEAFKGIPPETRQALNGGNTDFERILPGADRMYPDTDLPPQPIPDDTFARLQKLLPEKPWERRDVYKKLGLSDHLIDRLLNLELCDLYDNLLSACEFRPAPLASLLADRMRGSRRAGFDWMKTLKEEGIHSTIVWCSENGVTAKGSWHILDWMSENSGCTPKEAFNAVKPA
ncbi:MAG: Glu-tRNA(Gln) amidotransferase subunit GatE [Candidatus Fermentibacteria bacterium]|nr:Glu-tRNA(Gln) amidotransferase subunit GatE [Candidatus Fermentibacteria bacterium]